MQAISVIEREATAPHGAPPIRRQPGGSRSPDAQGGAVDVDLMLFFYAVAEELSFTKAAQKLGIDQSWLSHKIRQFEASVGVKLFIRNTRNVELTRAGVVLLDPARRLAEVARQPRRCCRPRSAASCASVRCRSASPTVTARPCSMRS